MTAAALAGLRGLFVEARPRVAAGAVPPPASAMPTIAVLCARPRAQAAAAALALALARSLGRPCAIAAAADAQAPAAVAAVVAPAAARAARRLRERGQPASAAGRLVRLAVAPARGDARSGAGPAADAVLAPGDDAAPATLRRWDALDLAAAATPSRDRDVAGLAAAASAALGRAATVAAAPAALALPFARVAALDRVLAWHDGIVVVREPGTAETILARALASLSALGRPIAVMAPLDRLAATAATLGLHAPAVALNAIAELGLPDTTPPPPGSGT